MAAAQSHAKRRSRRTGSFLVFANCTVLPIAGLVLWALILIASDSITMIEKISSVPNRRAMADTLLPESLDNSPSPPTQQHQQQQQQQEHTTQHFFVEYGDSIYRKGDWDGAPIVLKDYKLLFFTSAKVGCTVWKQLFRRMQGADDWNVQGTPQLLPWNPQTNGLVYLYHYDRATASHMLTSPDWTRALFVRDPKERFVSAHLDKAFHDTFLRDKCCRRRHQKNNDDDDDDCVGPARASAANFLRLIVRTCPNPHWQPQSQRIQERKYWPLINFVGHMETVDGDAERLLRKIGAWEEFGASGWGKNGDEAIFCKSGGAGREHATGAASKLREYISPELEKELDEFYKDDYESPFLNLTRLKLY